MILLKWVAFMYQLDFVILDINEHAQTKIILGGLSWLQWDVRLIERKESGLFMHKSS